MIINHLLFWFPPLQHLRFVDYQYLAGISSYFEHETRLPDANFELLLDFHVRHSHEHKIISNSKQYFLTAVVLLQNLEPAVDWDFHLALLQLIPIDGVAELMRLSANQEHQIKWVVQN